MNNRDIYRIRLSHLYFGHHQATEEEINKEVEKRANLKIKETKEGIG